MSERGTRPNDIGKLGWRTNAGGNTVTEIPSADRALGYAYTDPYQHQYANWRYKLYGEVYEYMLKTHVREFTSLQEGIEAVGELNDAWIFEPTRFVVTQPRTALDNISYYLGQQEWSVSDAGTTLWVTNICTTGQYVYFVNNDTVYCKNCMDGADSTEWNNYQTAGSPTCATTDGLAVYVGDTGTPGVILLDATSGDEQTIIDDHSSTYVTDARGNGYNLVVCDQTNQNYLYVYSNIVMSPSYDGTYDHGAVVREMAIGRDRVFFLGDDNPSGESVVGVDLASRTKKWSIDFTSAADMGAYQCSAQPTNRNAIITDGRDVYVGVAPTALVAGGQAGLFRFHAYTGACLGAIDVAPVSMGLNDEQLWVGQAGSTVVLDRDMQILTSIDDHLVYAVDGMGAMGRYYSQNNTLRRFHRGGSAREFMLADPRDPNRSPQYQLAVPVNHHAA